MNRPILHGLIGESIVFRSQTSEALIQLRTLLESREKEKVPLIR